MTIRPIDMILDGWALSKSKKVFPPGTRKKYGDFFYIKQGDGTWKYDSDSQSATPAKATPPPVKTTASAPVLNTAINPVSPLMQPFIPLARSGGSADTIAYVKDIKGVSLDTREYFKNTYMTDANGDAISEAEAWQNFVKHVHDTLGIDNSITPAQAVSMSTGAGIVAAANAVAGVAVPAGVPAMVVGSGSGGISSKINAMAAASAPVVAPAASTPAAAPQSDFDKMYAGLTQVAPSVFKAIQARTTRRDRLSKGQQVIYTGTYSGNAKYRGQVGTLIAIGIGGVAKVKMSDGRLIEATWQSLKPSGGIKPHSLYDGLSEENVYHCVGPVAAKIKEIMGSQIGSSGKTYADLCAAFKAKGFTMYIVGGTVRDIMTGKDAKDVDFIVDATDREIAKILENYNPKWTTVTPSYKPVINSHLGLYSFTDGADTVDITPVHMYSEDMQSMAKGWNLKEDAHARDFKMNSVHVDPVSLLMIDGTGKGLQHMKDNTMEFCDTSYLKHVPRYTLRAFKFLARGYVADATTKAAIEVNLPYVRKLQPARRADFLRSQIVGKDGKAGLEKFKEEFKKYDKSNIWDTYMDAAYNEVYASI